MSHKSIRLLLESTVRNLQDNIQYSYATDSDFNQDQKPATTLVNLSPLVAAATYADNNVFNYRKTWSVEMAFWEQPVKEYANTTFQDTLDRMDALVDRFINDLNFFASRSDDIVLQGMSQQPFIKATADILTGYVLTFQILVTDDFEYCVDC